MKDIQSLIRHKDLSATSSHNSSEGQSSSKTSLKHLIADATVAAETRLATIVSELEQQSFKSAKQAKALRHDAATLAASLAGLLKLLPEAVTASPRASLKDALKDFR